MPKTLDLVYTKVLLPLETNLYSALTKYCTFSDFYMISRAEPTYGFHPIGKVVNTKFMYQTVKKTTWKHFFNTSSSQVEARVLQFIVYGNFMYICEFHVYLYFVHKPTAAINYSVFISIVNLVTIGL